MLVYHLYFLYRKGFFFPFCNDLNCAVNKNVFCRLDYVCRRHISVDVKVFAITPVDVYRYTLLIFNESNHIKCQKKRETWSQICAWVPVSKKWMSKCDCIQVPTHAQACAHPCTQVWIQVGTWYHSATEHQTLSICRNLVWSQQQNGTILCHSVWCRKRSQMTGNHKTNVISFSEALCLNN